MSDQSRQIIPISFHQDTLYAVKDGNVTHVAIKEIAERLGLDWSSQHKRMSRNSILKEGMVMMTIPSAGGEQETTMLRLELLNGWLLGIDVNRVTEQYRPAILTYQRECYAVLHQHFFASRDEASRGPTYAAVQEMIKAEVAEAVRLLKGAVWGMTKGQTAQMNTRHDRHDDDLNTIGVTALETKDIVDMKSINVILSGRNIQTDRNFSNKCSASLRDFCMARGILTTRSPETRAHMFPSMAVNPWFQERGAALVKDRVQADKVAAKQRRDRIAGQTSMVFPLVPKKPG